jgi:SAM-dependent methyltransferase
MLDQNALLMEVARCPRCLSSVEWFEAPKSRCSNPECAMHLTGFPTVANQPVLIDFEHSIFDPSAYVDAQGSGSVLPRDNTGRSIRTRVKRFITGSNLVATDNGREFVKRLKALAARPKVLVIGGGSIGSGAEGLYGDPDIDILGTDVYASPFTCAIVDGHNLPFCTLAFDGVWIQAVLEHVLDPDIVAAQIFRVLKPCGLVYSEIPFMQQVHEGAYDFTRFTLSGHRWLFKQFEQIAAGPVEGAGTSAVWSFRYLCRALGASDKVATLLSLAVFWLRFLDHLTKHRPNLDGASGTYFFGAKSERTLTSREMVHYYEEQTNAQGPAPR